MANTRRDFLRLSVAPAGALLLAACGGGSNATAIESPLAPPTAADPTPTPDPSPVAPPASHGPLPEWVATLPLWQWHEIPNTALSSVEPTVRPLGITGPRSKVDAWCGATLKRRDSVYMLGAAGGHGDYAGNEVDALQLNAATPQWVQLRGPTSNADIVNATQFYLDHRPAATHTYHATQFIEPLNRMMVFGGGGLNGPFPAAPSDFPYKGDKRSFSFNLATGDWDAPDYVALFPGTGDPTACLCVKHPWTNDVYYSRSYGTGWYRWTCVSNTWTRLSSVSRAPWYAGAAIDPLRGRMLLVGGYGSVAPEVRRLDGTPIAVQFLGLGVGSLTLGGQPSVVYDETNDRFVVACNVGTGINVLRVHPETWSVDDPGVTGPTPAARPNGLFNSVQYVPELRGMVVVNRYDGNAFFVRTAN